MTDESQDVATGDGKEENGSSGVFLAVVTFFAGLLLGFLLLAGESHDDIKKAITETDTEVNSAWVQSAIDAGAAHHDPRNGFVYWENGVPTPGQ